MSGLWPWLAGVLVAALLSGARRRPSPGAAGVGIHPPPRWRAAGPTLRVGTYNIRHAKGLDGRTDIERVARHLDGVDLAGLYEVAGSRWPGGPDQAQRLAVRCGLGWLFVPTQRRWGRDDRGNALLSAVPVADWYQEPLADCSGTHFRKLTSARLAWRGRHLTVLSVHVSKRADQRVQLERVVDRFLSEECVVLMGDFNATRAHPLLAGLLARDDVIDAVATILGADDPADRIDWLLVRGLGVAGGGHAPPGASDHPYYWVDLTIS